MTRRCRRRSGHAGDGMRVAVSKCRSGHYLLHVDEGEARFLDCTLECGWAEQPPRSNPQHTAIHVNRLQCGPWQVLYRACHGPGLSGGGKAAHMDFMEPVARRKGAGLGHADTGNKGENKDKNAQFPHDHYSAQALAVDGVVGWPAQRALLRHRSVTRGDYCT